MREVGVFLFLFPPVRVSAHVLTNRLPRYAGLSRFSAFFSPLFTLQTSSTETEKRLFLPLEQEQKKETEEKSEREFRVKDRKRRTEHD